MSGVYRVDLAHDPAMESLGVWEATAYRISDGGYVGVERADTPEEAIDKVRELVAKRAGAHEPFSVELDEEGRIVSQSVRS